MTFMNEAGSIHFHYEFAVVVLGCLSLYFFKACGESQHYPKKLYSRFMTGENSDLFFLKCQVITSICAEPG